jgi:thymidylate synthase (FAD)
MKAELIDSYGSDLLVVNCARVSMGKWHDKFEDPGDTKLIGYLAKENHFMPFCHPHCTIRITAPIFVARQMAKHQIGFSWSEESGRYVELGDSFYTPDTFRKQSPDIKQGSLDEAVDIDNLLIEGYIDDAEALYKYLLEKGVCKEQARMYLPMNVEVTWIWTGSLYGWTRLYNLRKPGTHAQKESQDLAEQIGGIVAPLYPVSWAALTQ